MTQEQITSYCVALIPTMAYTALRYAENGNAKDAAELARNAASCAFAAYPELREASND
jgi:hypothetical protein